MCDENQALEFVRFHEESKPSPARPRKFGKVFDQSQALRSARNDQQIVVLVESQALVQEFLNAGSEAVVTAKHDEGVGGLGIHFCLRLKRWHDGKPPSSSLPRHGA